MKYELFDSHCHVDDPRFAEDIDEVQARMTEHGVTRYAVIGSDMASSRHAIDFAQAHEGAYAVVGIHPHEAKTYQEGDLDTLAAWLKEDKVQAIGENPEAAFVDDVVSAVAVTPMSRSPLPTQSNFACCAPSSA